MNVSLKKQIFFCNCQQVEGLQTFYYLETWALRAVLTPSGSLLLLLLLLLGPPLLPLRDLGQLRLQSHSLPYLPFCSPTEARFLLTQVPPTSTPAPHSSVISPQGSQAHPSPRAVSMIFFSQQFVFLPRGPTELKPGTSWIRNSFCFRKLRFKRELSKHHRPPCFSPQIPAAPPGLHSSPMGSQTHLGSLFTTH
jgi:hypothetical protein